MASEETTDKSTQSIGEELVIDDFGPGEVGCAHGIETNKSKLADDNVSKILKTLESTRDVKAGMRDNEMPLRNQEQSNEKALASQEANILVVEQNIIQKIKDDEDPKELKAKQGETQRLRDQLEVEDSQLESDLQKLKEVAEAEAKLGKYHKTELMATEITRLELELKSQRMEQIELAAVYKSESSRLQALDSLANELTLEKTDVESKINDQRATLAKATNEPKMLANQIAGLEEQLVLQGKDSERLEHIMNELQSRICQKRQQQRFTQQAKKANEDDISLQSSIHDAKRQEVSTMEEKLEIAKSQYHDLTTSGLEMELSLKEDKERLRHVKTIAALEKRHLDVAKCTYIKKRQVSDKAKDVIPELRLKLKDAMVDLAVYKKDNIFLQQSIEDTKEETEINRLKVLRQENVGKHYESKLINLTEKFEEKETEIDNWRIEEKKLCKTISVMEAQRDVLLKKAAQIKASAKEIEQQKTLKELAVLDLKKVSHETNKRCAEFEALYTTLKFEQESASRAIGVSEKSLEKLKIKVNAMKLEVDTLKSESEDKSAILVKEYDAHECSLARRATLRADKTRIRGLLRDKFDQAEGQKIQIDKLTATASSLAKGVKRHKVQNGQIAGAKQVMVGQLEDHNKELYRCYERSNLYESTLGSGEVAIAERKDYIRTLTLRLSNLRRTVEVAKSNMTETLNYEERIQQLVRSINDERKVIKVLEMDIEDPNNDARSRPLGGEDLDREALLARVEDLERRLTHNKNCLHTKEIRLEEITSQLNKIEDQVRMQTSETRPLIREANIRQGKIQEITKSVIALMGELQMYHTCIVKLSDQKEILEDALREGDPEKSALKSLEQHLPLALEG